MKILLQDSVQRKKLKAIERKLYTSQAFVSANNEEYEIQLAFHNMTKWNDAKFRNQTEFQMKALNRDFSAMSESDDRFIPAGIKFSTGTIKAKSLDLRWENWNTHKTRSSNYEINIWVFDLPDTIGSYASWPEGNPDIDGIVIDQSYFGNGEYSNYNQGKTLSTLIAMHFGLKPLLGSHPCADDGVRDTPPYEFKSSCNEEGVSRCSGQDLMPGNMMAPTNDLCRSFFTIGQVHRMKYFLENTTTLTNKLKN